MLYILLLQRDNGYVLFLYMYQTSNMTNNHPTMSLLVLVYTLTGQSYHKICIYKALRLPTLWLFST